MYSMIPAARRPFLQLFRAAGPPPRRPSARARQRPFDRPRPPGVQTTQPRVRRNANAQRLAGELATGSGARRPQQVKFIPRGWNLFFSGTGTADFHPEVLEKARPISPLAEIRQNNARKNCGKDLNSTPWFAPFYCLFVRPQSRDY